jgi:AcrR family transcriptional regulator
MTVVDQRRVRGERNRIALLDAALELFRTTGYEATTVEQIAARAGVAPRTFFHHFPSKEDVLFDGYAERLQEVELRFRASSRTGSLWSAMSEVASAVARSILEEPRRYLERARLYEEVPALRARMLRINEEWIDGMATEVARRLGTDPRTDVRPRLAATLVNGANRAAIEVWVGSGGRTDLLRVMTESLALLRPTITRIERSATPMRGARAG